MGFLNDQVSYGPPADYSPRNQELEGKYQAYQDFKPEAAKSALSTGITNIAGKDVRHITRTDKQHVDQLKEYVNGKTSDFQSRIDKGENTSSVFKEAAQLKNQYEQATQELNKRADIQEAFDTELKKSGLSPQEQDILKEVQYNNISAFTKENGFIANGMPTFPIAKAVNYNEIARKAIADVAERVTEDDPSYETWKQLSVDSTKYQQVLKTMKSKDRDDFYSAFSQQLADDPDAMKYLTQTANSQLFVAYQTGTDFRQEGADMNIGEMPDEKFANAQQFIDNNKEELKQQLIQSKIHSVSSKLAGVAAYDNVTYSDKLLDNTEAVARTQKKVERERLFTIANESVLTPGEPMDYKSLSDKKTTLEQGLLQLPIPGSANDNYETQSQREDITKRLAIINNTLNTGTTKYINTTEGQTTIKEIYKDYLKSGIIQDVGGKSPIKAGLQEIPKETYAEIKKYIPNSKIFSQFMAGKLELPQELLNKVIGEEVTLTGRKPITLGSLKNNEKLQKNVSNYIEKNPISYSANVLTGEDKSTVDQYNKTLTDRVVTQGTNYTTSDGVQLNVYMSKNLAEGDKIQVSGMDDAIGGQYAHYLTIRNKAGNKKIEMPIYPKVGAKEEMGYVGRNLMKDNKNQKDPLQQDQYQRGEKMLANSYFSDGINNDYIESYANLVENNGSSQNVKNITINLPSGSIPITIDVFKSNNITYYAPKNMKGEYIKSTTGKAEKEDKAYKSLTDMKVDLLKSFNLDITE